MLIAKRLRDVPVLCGADRAVLGQRAIEAFGSETLILDDGFQHRHLARDVDLVVLRAPRPFGNGRLLPRGPLREAVGALRRCDGIIVNTSDGPLAEPLPEWLADAVPVAEARARPTALIQLRQDEAQSLDRLRGRRVLVVAGVARPSSVVRTVEALDARVIELVARPDHHPWTEAEVETLGRRAAQADAVLLTTEKDAVKWTAPPVGSVALKIEAEVIGGGEALWRLVLGASSRATESLACSRSG